MKLKITVTGIAEIEVPKELQDDISCIDCGELYDIDSEPFDLE